MTPAYLALLETREDLTNVEELLLGEVRKLQKEIARLKRGNDALEDELDAVQEELDIR